MLLEATTEIASRITNAIRDAARATGASFDYLLKTALRESNLDPSAKASTSSATGLFQFVDQTWLETIKHADPALGYSRYADAIVQTSSGRYAVPDAKMRTEIMQLRNDPAASSAMAAAFTQRNSDTLTARLGRKPTDGELYVAHFLGVSGAGQLITTAFTSPQTKAADLFPDAARANRNIFYSRSGSARTASQVYALLVGKINGMPVPGAVSNSQVAAKTAPLAIERALAASAGTPESEPVSPIGVAAFAPEDGPVFHSLFRTERRGPVSNVVSELWGAKSVHFPDRAAAVPPTPPAAATKSSTTESSGADPGATSGRPLDLFQFLRPEVQGKARRPA